MASTDVFDISIGNGTMTELLQKVNSFTDVGYGGVLGILFLFVIGASLFLISRKYGNERALGISSFVVVFFAIIFRIFGLISDGVLTICIILFILGVGMLIKDSAQYEQ